MKIAKVFINEQHRLLPQQEELLNKKFNYLESGYIENNPYEDVPVRGWEIYSVPSTGWTKKEMEEVVSSITDSKNKIVMVSPIPFLIREFTKKGTEVFLFHNDNREKTEKDGKIFYTVAGDGWQLI